MLNYKNKKGKEKVPETEWVLGKIKKREKAVQKNEYCCNLI